MIEAVGERAGKAEPGRSMARAPEDRGSFPAAAERALAAVRARTHGGVERRDGQGARAGAGCVQAEEAAGGPGGAAATELVELDLGDGEAAPARSAAAASLAAQVSVGREEGGRAQLDLRLGDWLQVRLEMGERGVAVTIACDRAVAPLLERSLPRLLGSLRRRGIAVARAEVVPFTRSGRRATR